MKEGKSDRNMSDKAMTKNPLALIPLISGVMGNSWCALSRSTSFLKLRSGGGKGNTLFCARIARTTRLMINFCVDNAFIL
jgi:hypothetical protein